MVERIIKELRSSERGSRVIIETAEHSHADSHAGRIKDAQMHLGRHIESKYNGRADKFLWYHGCNPDEVFSGVIMDYGRKSVGLD